MVPKAETPRRVWDADRIKNESQLKTEYGLRRTRELWSAVSELKKARRTARAMLSLGEAGREKGMQVIDKLQRLGIAKGDMRLEDVLGLSIRDYLERRLQTLVQRKGLGRTAKQSRQLIVHGFIAVGGRCVTIPSYMVTLAEEPTISYYKAIDIEPPQPENAPKGGVAGQRAARAKMATDAPASPDAAPETAAPKSPSGDSA